MNLENLEKANSLNGHLKALDSIMEHIQPDLEHLYLAFLTPAQIQRARCVLEEELAREIEVTKQRIFEL